MEIAQLFHLYQKRALFILFACDGVIVLRLETGNRIRCGKKIPGVSKVEVRR